MRWHGWVRAGRAGALHTPRSHPLHTPATSLPPSRSYVWLSEYQSQFLPILGLLGLRMAVGAGEWLLRKLGKEKKSEQARGCWFCYLGCGVGLLAAAAGPVKDWQAGERAGWWWFVWV